MITTRNTEDCVTAVSVKIHLSNQRVISKNVFWLTQPERGKVKENVQNPIYNYDIRESDSLLLIL